ncbi:glycosyltransferase, partial [Bacillus sp. JJ1562]|uniref:glycosyltransferase n=1 Tax=Bacillus sp. JJ1562 TaxID=3122960 RepID=UPI0030023D38
TEYIARMDADDISLPNRFLEQVEFLDNNSNVSVVGSWAYQINDYGEVKNTRYTPIKNEDIRKLILKASPMIHPTVMFRKEDIMSLGGYNIKYRYAQDYDLWFRCLSNGLELHNIGKPLLEYRVSENHSKKRGMKHRLLDASIRWNGSKLLGVPLFNRLISVSIPIVLGIMPNFLRKIIMKYGNRIDPRTKYKNFTKNI